MAPSTGADVQLVLDIVKFLAVVVKLSQAGTPPDNNNSSAANENFTWIGEMLLNNGGALYRLLNSTDQSAESTDRKSTNSSQAVR